MHKSKNERKKETLLNQEGFFIGEMHMANGETEPDYEWIADAFDEELQAQLANAKKAAELCGCRTCVSIFQHKEEVVNHWENCVGGGLDGEPQIDPTIPQEVADKWRMLEQDELSG